MKCPKCHGTGEIMSSVTGEELWRDGRYFVVQLEYPATLPLRTISWNGWKRRAEIALDRDLWEDELDRCLVLGGVPWLEPCDWNKNDDYLYRIVLIDEEGDA